MKYAIISDIHSNLPALETVLDLLDDRDIDEFLCTGDVVGYGASPNECCEIVRDLQPTVVKGNHDHAAVVPGGERNFNRAATACVLWTREALTAENRQFLADLERFADTELAHLCHGALFNADYYTTEPYGAAQSFQQMSLAMCFFGHSHRAGAFIETARGELPQEHTMPESAQLNIDADNRYIINPGSVGQPRDGNPRAAFAVWDTDNDIINFCRTQYDIQAAQKAIVDASLPAAMAQRLSEGL